MQSCQALSAARARRAALSFQLRESPGGYRLERVPLKYRWRTTWSGIDRSQNASIRSNSSARENAMTKLSRAVTGAVVESGMASHKRQAASYSGENLTTAGEKR